jgi:DNA recombination protein RmuC
MFVPIESALIEALQTDPELPTFSLQNKVALLSPTNLLVTLRTVGSVWSIHRQNTNAQEIASRAGRLYDKFADFVTALQQIGDRLRQAQDSYDTALTRLSSGTGNLLRQAELLKELGARTSKQIDPGLGKEDEIDDADDGTSSLRVVHEPRDSSGKNSH